MRVSQSKRSSSRLATRVGGLLCPWKVISANRMALSPFAKTVREMEKLLGVPETRSRFPGLAMRHWTFWWLGRGLEMHDKGRSASELVDTRS